MLSKTTKNRFSYKLDKLFWWLVALMPFIGYFGVVAFNGLTLAPGEAAVPSLPNFMYQYVFSGASFEGNPVWYILSNLFGSNGVFPIFTNQSSLLVFNWFIVVEIIHVCFDIIVFIPRLAHKWISKAVQDD